MQTLAEAIRKLMPHFEPRGCECLRVDDALGRYAATDVLASYPSPPFDNSAMDGYAVMASNVENATEAAPVVVRVATESKAGPEAPSAVPSNACARIFTGAPIPEGMDSVVIQENTERRGGEVAILSPSSQGQHIRKRGSDFHEGAVIVSQHQRFGAVEIGLLASQDIEEARVFTKPTVAILSTGDELRNLGSERRPGTIVNSNAHTLAAMVKEAGGVPVRLPIVGDSLEAIEASLRDGLTADLVITTGGASMGDYDFMREAMTRLGVENIFWKIRIKPGKPVGFGVAGGTPLISLPGNPVSAMVTFEILVRPAIRKMLGALRPHPPTFSARLKQQHNRRPGRLEFARAHAKRTPGGLEVELTQTQGSGDFSSAAGTNALAILPPDCGILKEGETVEVIPWSHAWDESEEIFIDRVP